MHLRVLLGLSASLKSSEHENADQTHDVDRNGDGIEVVEGQYHHLAIPQCPRVSYTQMTTSHPNDDAGSQPTVPHATDPCQLPGSVLRCFRGRFGATRYVRHRRVRIRRSGAGGGRVTLSFCADVLFATAVWSPRRWSTAQMACCSMNARHCSAAHAVSHHAQVSGDQRQHASRSSNRSLTPRRKFHPSMRAARSYDWSATWMLPCRSAGHNAPSSMCNVGSRPSASSVASPSG